jgi:arylsulfatase A-like enzyme
VVGDHGENLGDHGLFAHHSSLHETLLHVPLVVWGSGLDLAAGSAGEPVAMASLFGWLLSTADGRSAPLDAGGLVESEYESTIRHMGMPAYLARRIAEGDVAGIPALVHHAGVAIRDGDRKYVARADGSEAMFDLSADPHEERDILPNDPGAAEPYRARREAWLARRASIERADVASAAEEGSNQPAEDDIADHLRMLGYIE